MYRSAIWLALLCLSISAAGCQGLPFVFQPVTTPTPSLEPQITETQALPTPTDSPEPPSQLRLWLPPQFDPAGDTQAGEVLRQRLEAFLLLNPDLELDVRIKAESGSGGLLNGLTTASVAAPAALPDVVALPRPLLEAAALKGIVHPLEGLTNPLDAVEWYPYAVEMGYVQEKIYGLPFAADLMFLLERTALLAPEPVEATTQPVPTMTATPAGEDASDLLAGQFEWLGLVESNRMLAFPAADPRAVFTLLLYRSVGGALFDTEGRPFLDPDLLAEVLRVYQQAAQASVLPAWLIQLDRDEQVWEAFENGQVDMVVAWMSQYLAELNLTRPGQTAFDPVTQPVEGRIPSLNGQPYTFAKGWVWAVASPDTGRRERALELVEFLAQAGFLAEWNAALGLLPPRPDALAEWTAASGETSVTLRQLAVDLSTAASLQPSEDVLAVLGLPIYQAVVSVLNQQVEPDIAAHSAAAALNLP
jgi:multiple sugar transport system substrate-binding protein